MRSNVVRLIEVETIERSRRRDVLETTTRRHVVRLQALIAQLEADIADIDRRLAGA